MYKGFHPWSCFPALFLQALGESEELFDFNWQELNIETEALGVQQSICFSSSISFCADMGLAFLAFQASLSL